MIPTACGSTLTSTAASSNALLASANHVCRVYYDKAYSLPPPVGFKQLAQLAEEHQALSDQELSGLEALTPPPTLRASYDRYLSTMQELDRLSAPIAHEASSQLLALAGAHPTAKSQRELVLDRIKAHRVPSLSPAQRAAGERMAKLQARVEVQARALALTECAKNPYTAEHTYGEEGPAEGSAAHP